MNSLKSAAVNIRKTLVQAHARGRASHIGSSFSCLDIVVTLYSNILNINSMDSGDLQRDRFILSKGHGVSAVYGTLAYKELISKDWLFHYHEDGSNLSGHPDRFCVPFIEASTGSLGHGLPIGIGRALALKRSGNKARVFVLMSDGEVEEGSNWEAANNASRLKLDNVVAIIDANKWQSFDRTDDLMPIKSYKAKWESFGWEVREIDGHDFGQISGAFEELPYKKDSPSLVIAHTVKGKGIKDFEDQIGYHYWPPKIENVQAYLKELDA